MKFIHTGYLCGTIEYKAHGSKHSLRTPLLISTKESGKIMETKHFNPAIKDLVTAGDVCQIAPTVDGFGGCYLTITEVRKKSPYAIGYVAQPGRPDVPLMTRIKWADLEFVGKATWVNAELMIGELKAIADEAERKKAVDEVKASTGQPLKTKRAARG